VKLAWGRSLGLNERAIRAKQMLQVVNRADAECQKSAERAPSPQTPHPRAPDARSRGIKFPVSNAILSDLHYLADANKE
jgi:hypothetical protein